MLKNTILKFLVKTNAFAVARILNRSKVPILMYHRFSETDSPFSTSRANFRNHLQFLKKHYQIITLQNLIESRESGKPIPSNSVAITIDDGYKDVYDIAFPLLREFNAPATVFVVTNFLDKKCWVWTDVARYSLLNTQKKSVSFSLLGADENQNLSDRNSRILVAAKINSQLKKIDSKTRDQELKQLSRDLDVKIPEMPSEEFSSFNWDEAREMENRGIAIESHTVSHPIITLLNDSDLDFELKQSRTRIQEELQKNADIFCYPNGNCGIREFTSAKIAGYKSAVSTEFKLSTKSDNIFSLPRIDCDSDMTRFIRATSGFDELNPFA